MRIVPVILCGGRGERLWPVSRMDRPKPFHHFGAQASLFQATLERFGDPQRFEPPLILCAREHEGVVREQVGDRTISGLIMEGGPGGTALACAVAALARPHDALLITPADHLIEAPEVLMRAIEAAAPLLDEARICLFACPPDHASSAYGHVRAGAVAGPGVARVEAFVEKPAAARALEMIAEGGWAWNMGLFLGQAGAFTRALARHAPDILDQAARLWSRRERAGDDAVLIPPAQVSAPVSIDTAVMERSDDLLVARCDPLWRDVGCWNGLWRHAARDGTGNWVTGRATARESTGCVVLGDGPPVTAIGLTDMVVISTDQGVLVMPRARAQELRAAGLWSEQEHW
ncbi:MAG: mannose-1-phosphate guanylyltransferase [Brevundimonas sp.]|uniref:mannose-1-phosphate guanylyltransferase n=1 Tax=Brevundimonas sp. TaxID=1871086 RepID=UPI00391A6E75